MSLHERLKKARNALGISQKDAAVAVGVATRTWQVYEEGGSVPGGNALEGIAKLGIDINWLLTGQGEMLLKKPAPEIVADADGVYRQRFTIKAPTWGFALVSSVEELIEAEVERRVRASARADVDPRLRDLKWWLEDFWKDADEERRTWLIVEMKRVYPEFREWLESKEKKEKSIACDCEPMDGFNLF